MAVFIPASTASGVCSQLLMEGRLLCRSAKRKADAEKFLLAFIPLFVAIDPIGLVAIFVGLGARSEGLRRQREGELALVTALAVSIGFIFLGKIIFRALGITVADFQVAGGLILLGLAVRELLDLGPKDRYGGEDFGIVPLGMPLIAGPALLTALLILIDSVGIIFTLVSLVLKLLLVGIGFRYAVSRQIIGANFAPRRVAIRINAKCAGPRGRRRRSRVSDS